MKATHRAALAAAILLAISASALCAQSPAAPTNEDMRHVRSMAQPRLSPDGRSVLVQGTDSTADGAKSHLWLVDIAQNSARQLTVSPAAEKRGEYSGEWMPDSGSILFLAHRGEHTQLYRLPLTGGEAQPYDLKITPIMDESTAPDAIPPRKDAAPKPEPVKIDVAHFSVSPDGRNIAIVARDPETPGEKKQHDEKADAVLVDQDPHGSRLYLLDPASGKLTPTAVPADVGRIAWDRRGERLIAVCEGRNNAGDLGPASSAWMLSVSDPEHPSQLKSIPATIEGGTWSEDGKRFYFLAQSQQDAPPGYADLYAAELSGGIVRDLTPRLDGSLSHELPIAAGGGIYEGVEMGTHVGVLRFDKDSGNAPPDVLKFETPAVTQLNTNARESGWVWLGAGSTQSNTLYFAEKLGGSAKALHVPEIVPAEWPRAASKLVHWTNEGLTLEGLLYLPPQAATGKVPLVVSIHGGPTGAWEDSYSPLVQFFMAQGWAVFEPNPRGSTGYGAAFAAANKNDLGGADYRDIMTGVDSVLAQFSVDPNRMALFGYSYGGEMAGFVEGKTDRFKAIVSGAPVIDQSSEYGTESGSWYDRWFYGKPWEHPQDAWRQSPLAGAARAKTPFLLLQGQADTIDPLGQSEEMYRALRQQGVPVQLVTYPRDNHGPLILAIMGMPVPEPWHGFDARQRTLKFISDAFAK